jgi:hypothetical protein
VATGFAHARCAHAWRAEQRPYALIGGTRPSPERAGPARDRPPSGQARASPGRGGRGPGPPTCAPGRSGGDGRERRGRSRRPRGVTRATRSPASMSRTGNAPGGSGGSRGGGGCRAGWLLTDLLAVRVLSGSPMMPRYEPLEALLPLWTPLSFPLSPPRCLPSRLGSGLSSGSCGWTGGSSLLEPTSPARKVSAERLSLRLFGSFRARRVLPCSPRPATDNPIRGASVAAVQRAQGRRGCHHDGS